MQCARADGLSAGTEGRIERPVIMRFCGSKRFSEGRPSGEDGDMLWMFEFRDDMLINHKSRFARKD
jgi:hypothetical protein